MPGPCPLQRKLRLGPHLNDLQNHSLTNSLAIPSLEGETAVEGAEMSLRSPMAFALAALAASSGTAIVETLRAPAVTRTAETGKIPDNPPSACPITKPPAQPFIPPAPYPAKADPPCFWFGTEKLWTILSSDGTWRGLPHYTPGDPAFRQKLFWWRRGYDVRTEPQPKLTVTGMRLDSSAPPVFLADHASNGWQQEDQPFIVVGINLPTLGCWKITGHYEHEELSFVVREIGRAHV